MTILRAFVETKCESCGGQKRKNTAFCSSCYFKLPVAQRNLLWNRFGEGFEEAYRNALEWFSREGHTEHCRDMQRRGYGCVCGRMIVKGEKWKSNTQSKR